MPLPRPMLDKLRRLWMTHRNPRWLFPDRAGTRPVTKTRWPVPSVSPPAPPASASGQSPRLRHSYATRLLEQGTERAWCRSCSATSTSLNDAVYLHLTEPTRA